MEDRFLEVCFRKGRVLAAYLYFQREKFAVVEESEEIAPGLMLDRDAFGRPLGLEILSLSEVTFNALNQTLKQIEQPPIDRSEIEPLGLSA